MVIRPVCVAWQPARHSSWHVLSRGGSVNSTTAQHQLEVYNNQYFLFFLFWYFCELPRNKRRSAFYSNSKKRNNWTQSLTSTYAKRQKNIKMDTLLSYSNQLHTILLQLHRFRHCLLSFARSCIFHHNLRISTVDTKLLYWTYQDLETHLTRPTPLYSGTVRSRNVEIDSIVRIFTFYNVDKTAGLSVCSLCMSVCLFVCLLLLNAWKNYFKPGTVLVCMLWLKKSAGYIITFMSVRPKWPRASWKNPSSFLFMFFLVSIVAMSYCIGCRNQHFASLTRPISSNEDSAKDKLIYHLSDVGNDDNDSGRLDRV